MEDSQAPDGPLNPEQAAIAASLSADLVRRIDEAILSHADRYEKKVAMIVGLTMLNPELRVAGLPDLYYVERVKELVRRGLLIAVGNIDCMRHSEVRRP